MYCYAGGNVGKNILQSLGNLLRFYYNRPTDKDFRTCVTLGHNLKLTLGIFEGSFIFDNKEEPGRRMGVRIKRCVG